MTTIRPTGATGNCCASIVTTTNTRGIRWQTHLTSRLRTGRKITLRPSPPLLILRTCSSAKPNRVLKKPQFSPAQPRCAKTHPSPASFSPRKHSQRSPLGEQAVLAAWGGWVRMLRLRCFHRLRPCWTDFLSTLRAIEWPVAKVEIRTHHTSFLVRLAHISRFSLQPRVMDWWLLVRRMCYTLPALNLRPLVPCHSPYDHESFPSPRSVARDYAGNHCQGTGRAVWMGRDGTPCPDPLFPPRSQREIQSHVSPENALGARASRRVVHRV